MKSRIIPIDNFQRKAKPLLKKYASLSRELEALEQELLRNPRMGTSIGGNVYKIRLAVKSKGKGKSGGMRVITYVFEIEVAVEETPEQDVTVFLLTIYDKSEQENISEKDLKNLIKDIDFESLDRE
jgi:hypothetical protein